MRTTNAGYGKRQGSVDTAKKDSEGRSGGDLRRAQPTKYPPTLRVAWVDEVQVPVKVPQRLLAKHAAGEWELVSGSDSLITRNDASKMIKLRFVFGPPAKGNAVVLADVVPSAPQVLCGLCKLSASLLDDSR